MLFTRRLRDGIRRGRIRCTVRIWTRLAVKVGGRYRMDEGHVVVDAIDRIRRADITDALARESGFDDVKDLLATAKHGEGHEIYLIRFHYLAPGAWDDAKAPAKRRARRPATGEDAPVAGADLLRRIRRAVPVHKRPKSRG
ncbi:MAG: hypothetical protein R2745_15465 [Vicinamibacterales bacterium]